VKADIRRPSPDEFKALAYDFMACIFKVHNEIGRFCEEKINQPMPYIAIIDWEASPLDDTDGAVERDVIGDAARVKRFLCSSDADFNDEICGADALIVWHTTPKGGMGKGGTGKGIWIR